MRRLFVLLLTPVLGCASGSPPSSDGALTDQRAQPPPMVEAGADGFTIRLNRDDGLTVATIVGRPAAVFQALLSAFEDLGIEIGGADRARGLVQSERMNVVRDFAGERLSLLLNCGATISGDRADTWRIELDISAQVQAEDADRTRMTMRLLATAKTLGGASSNPIGCATRGRLEQRLVQATSVRLLRGTTP